MLSAKSTRKQMLIKCNILQLQQSSFSSYVYCFVPSRGWTLLFCANNRCYVNKRPSQRYGATNFLTLNQSGATQFFTIKRNFPKIFPTRPNTKTSSNVVVFSVNALIYSQLQFTSKTISSAPHVKGQDLKFVSLSYMCIFLFLAKHVKYLLRFCKAHFELS